MDRAACLDYIYADCLVQQFIFREAFDAAMTEWEVEPIMANEKSIGVMATKDHELHVTLDKLDAKRYAKRIIKECLTKRIEQQGYLVTRARIGDTKIFRFLDRLGFYQTHFDADCIYFRIDQTKIQ